MSRRELTTRASSPGHNTLSLSASAPEPVVRAVAAYAKRHNTTPAQVVRDAVSLLLASEVRS